MAVRGVAADGRDSCARASRTLGMIGTETTGGARCMRAGGIPPIRRSRDVIGEMKEREWEAECARTMRAMEVPSPFPYEEREKRKNGRMRANEAAPLSPVSGKMESIRTRDIMSGKVDG